MQRKLARENAFLLIFESLFKNDETAEEIFVKATELRGLEYDDYVKTVFFGIFENKRIIEELIDVERELECGYFSVRGKTVFTVVGEICADGFYDYEKKYFGSTAKVSSRASVCEREVGLIQSYASLLAEYLGLRALSRIDFFRTARGEIIFNEINTMPGFTETSLYPRLCAESGISPALLVNGLIADAVKI